MSMADSFVTLFSVLPVKNSLHDSGHCAHLSEKAESRQGCRFDPHMGKPHIPALRGVGREDPQDPFQLYDSMRI